MKRASDAVLMEDDLKRIKTEDGVEYVNLKNTKFIFLLNFLVSNYY